MKKNMGSLDKIIRILLVIAIGVLYYTKVIDGTLALILGAFAVVLLLTSLISFCPLYLPFGINTKRK
jgi:hypothetical protein